MKKLVTAAVLSAMSSIAMAECGNVTISEMDWASAEFAANLDKIILEEGFGCQVDLVPGATVTTLTSMESKGKPHIAPEFWANAVLDRLNQAQQDGKVSISTRLIPDAADGWYVSKYVAENYPDINSVDDVLARPDLFPSKENPGKAQFMTCPSGWSCQTVNTNLAKPSAFNFDKAGFVAVDPGSAAGLDGAIARAYDRDEAWFGYYWQPSAVLAKYELKRLEFPEDFDQQHWNECIGKEDCDTPKRSRFTETHVYTVVASEFEQQQPEVAEYLKKRAYNSEQVGKILVYMSENQATGEDGALEFLMTQEDVWTKWLAPEVVEKVKAAL